MLSHRGGPMQPQFYGQDAERQKNGDDRKANHDPLRLRPFDQGAQQSLRRVVAVFGQARRPHKQSQHHGPRDKHDRPEQQDQRAGPQEAAFGPAELQAAKAQTFGRGKTLPKQRDAVQRSRRRRMGDQARHDQGATQPDIEMRQMPQQQDHKQNTQNRARLTPQQRQALPGRLQRTDQMKGRAETHCRNPQKPDNPQR